MDAFKPAELARMALGGNKPWREFWAAHPLGGGAGGEGKRWEDMGIEERYGGAVGEEWKGRLSARCEGREYVAVERVRDASPRDRGGGANARNESFFARKGADNATRPSDLPPSQGGKYAGFGSEPPTARGGGEAQLPGVDAFQQDPVAALTRGLGWFAGAVGKGARSVNEGWIVPAAQKVCRIPFPPLPYLNRFRHVHVQTQNWHRAC